MDLKQACLGTDIYECAQFITVKMTKHLDLVNVVS